MVVCVNCDTWLLSGVCVLPKVKLAVPAGLIAFASVLPLMEGSRSSGLAWLLLAGLKLRGCCLLICCWSAYNGRQKSCMHNMILHLYLSLDYFMRSERILYSCMSCWRVRKQSSEYSAQVSFWIYKNECIKILQSTFHAIICLFYTCTCTYLLRFITFNILKKLNTCFFIQQNN